MQMRSAVLGLCCALAQAQSQPGWRATLDRAIQLRETRTGAEAVFLQAVGEAKEAGEVPLAVVWHQLAIYHQQHGRHNEAARLLRDTLALYARHPEAPRMDVGAAMHTLAITYRALAKVPEAQSLHASANALIEQAVGPKHRLFVLGQSFLGILMLDQGRLNEAEALFTGALRIGSEAIGRDDPDLGLSLMGMAAVRRLRGDFAAGKQMATRALRILENAYGRDDVRLTGTLHELAQLEVETGDFRQAEAYWRRGLEITQKRRHPLHPDAIAYQVQLADIASWRGRHGEAEELFSRAAAAAEQTGANAVLGLSLHHWAALERLRKRYDRAESLYRRALEATEKSAATRNTEWAIAAAGLARTLLDLRRTEEAEICLRAAIDAAEKANAVTHPIFLGALKEHERVLRALKRKEEARLVSERYRALAASGAGRSGDYTVSLREMTSRR